MTNLKNRIGQTAFASSLVTMAFAAADAGAAPVQKPRAGQRPHLIVIMTDQQTAGAMSCAGNSWVETPAMDALAADGVRFTRAYCPYPLSGPCRASIVTGRMPFEVGATDNAVRPHAEDMALGIGHRISAAGYECLYAGKWHVPEVNLPDSGTGFRRISPMHDPTLADACDRALAEYDGAKPLFLVASLLNPHEICEYGRFESLHYGQLPDFATEECPNLPANFMPSTYEPEALRLEQAASPRYHDTYTCTQDDWRRYLYAYYRLVERVDREVGIREGFYFLVIAPRKRNRRRPEHAVVRDEQIRAHVRRKLHLPEPRVNGGGYRAHFPAVGALQAVFRAVVVLELPDAQAGVHKSRYLAEIGALFYLRVFHGFFGI